MVQNGAVDDGRAPTGSRRRRRRSVRLAAAAVAALVALAPAAARGDTAMVAVIVGVNASVDPELPLLRYADDDAALYDELFQRLGARTYLLTRPDDNTRRLHVQVSAAAQPPRRSDLDRAIASAAASVIEAHGRGESTALYFVYAGHGNIRDGESYIGLEDDRLTASDLTRRVIDAVPADQIHVIIDACYSGLLARPRGPGGERRPLQGFSRFHGLASDDRIGLLLSTSSARESHEWDGFEAGVFSYEVRSGMYGAADADGDGQISYREIAAFVARANAAIPGERFRPDVYARPPRSGRPLVDLRSALHRRIEIDGSLGAHYLLEDERGVRILDFHNGAGQNVALVRPAATGDLYLRRLSDNREYRVAAGAADVVAIAGMSAHDPRTLGRGAASASFRLTFSLQFDQDVVRRFELAQPEVGEVPPPARSSWRRPAAWTAFGVGGGALATGVVFALSARALHDDASPLDSQTSVVQRNRKIAWRNTAAAISFGVAAAAVVTGAVLVLWPDAQPHTMGAVQPVAGGAVLTVARTF